uniref:hypothetical protein n=1 Tax=Streptomyces caniscabiei TaxID=2746961 RepID=UPI000AD780CB
PGRPHRSPHAAFRCSHAVARWPAWWRTEHHPIHPIHQIHQIHPIHRIYLIHQISLKQLDSPGALEHLTHAKTR